MPGLLAGRYATGNSTAVGRYTETLARLFRAIRDVSGCNVVVDSSKIPSHGLILAKADVNLSVVHLVRDSRGVAYSAGKRVTKERTDAPPTLLPRYGAAAAAGRYMFYNGATSALKRLEIPYLRVRYEDLVEDPARRLREILAFVGENADADLSFVRQGSVSLGENHLVDGNPVRSARGQVSLQIDDDWRTRLPRRRRYVVTALTLPLLTAYGYPR
jgi:hypothetical protein